MFRKKRFKRYTLGRLQNFIKKKAYTGYIFYNKVKRPTLLSFLPNNEKCFIKHYVNVTKKKIHYTHYKIC